MTWGLQCAGPNVDSYCFTGAGREGTPTVGSSSTPPNVLVEDTVAPDLSGTPSETGYRRPADGFPVSARDSAGIRSLRVLVDGEERLNSRPACDYRYASPCPVDGSQLVSLASEPDGQHTVTIIAEDPAANVGRLDRTVLLDGTAPVIDEVPVTGRKITARVADAASGMASGAIAVRDKSTKPFRLIKTTLRNGQLVATVPASISMSNLAIRVSATDKAGNTVTSAVTSMSLSTRVGSRSARKVQNSRASIPYGRTATVLGRLTTTDGAALAGQPIVISGTLRRTGATARQLLSATTDRTGRFSVRIPAGPSQNLTVSYPGGAGLVHRDRAVALLVPASASIRASTATLRGAGPSASPAACARSARPSRPAARSSTSRRCSAGAG